MSPVQLTRDASHTLHHDLSTPLTVITARSQLLERHLERLPDLSSEEREQLLHSVHAILVAARTQAAVIANLPVSLESRNEDTDPV